MYMYNIYIIYIIYIICMYVCTYRISDNIFHRQIKQIVLSRKVPLSFFFNIASFAIFKKIFKICCDISYIAQSSTHGSC